MVISKRHLFKSITWRLIATLDTLLFSFLITSNISQGINITLIDSILKLLGYYFHELLWFSSKFNSSHKRHIIKTITWRLIATVITSINTYIVTGSFLLGVKLVTIESLSKVILYFFHEKMWYKTKFGLT